MRVEVADRRSELVLFALFATLHMKEVEYLARGPIPLWYRASRQIMSEEKFTNVLLGDAIGADRPALKVREWQRYGRDQTDKSLGISELVIRSKSPISGRRSAKK